MGSARGSAITELFPPTLYLFAGITLVIGRRDISLREVDSVELLSLNGVGGLATTLSRADLQFPANQPLVYSNLWL